MKFRIRKKWVKISRKEVVENYSDVLRQLWHRGPVEGYLDHFFVNPASGKIKIKGI